MPSPFQTPATARRLDGILAHIDAHLADPLPLQSLAAMALSNFKVLTFDVVGTLIDFERGMLDYLRRAVPDATVSDDDFLAAYRNARASANCGAFPDDLERVWNEVAVAVGLPDTPELA